MQMLLSITIVGITDSGCCREIARMQRKMSIMPQAYRGFHIMRFSGRIYSGYYPLPVGRKGINDEMVLSILLSSHPLRRILDVGHCIDGVGWPMFQVQA